MFSLFTLGQRGQSTEDCFVCCSVTSNSLRPHGPVAHQAPLSMGVSRQEYWSGLPIPSAVRLPHPVIEPGSPALQADSLPSESSGKPQRLLWGLLV